MHARPFPKAVRTIVPSDDFCRRTGRDAKIRDRRIYHGIRADDAVFPDGCARKNDCVLADPGLCAYPDFGRFSDALSVDWNRNVFIFMAVVGDKNVSSKQDMVFYDDFFYRGNSRVHADGHIVLQNKKRLVVAGPIGHHLDPAIGVDYYIVSNLNMAQIVKPQRRRDD
jgi:hypothetical protein